MAIQITNRKPIQNTIRKLILIFPAHLHQCFNKYTIIHAIDREADYLYSVYRAGQHVVKSAVRESESAMTRERLNRLWARPFVDSSSSCTPSWGPEGGEKGGGERKRLVEKKGIPSMVANGMTGQRESRRRWLRGEGGGRWGEEKRAERMG